jgi:dTDP-4-dehydrorhamnose reductase
MKILVLGGTGMLGHQLVKSWRKHFDVWTTLRGNFDTVERYGIFQKEKTICGVTAEDFDSIVNAFAIVKPNVVMNCIGVIKQSKTSKNPVVTLSTNAIFPHRVAALCQTAGARFITLSTDCVFAGTRGNYSESDTPDALDLYGQSKRWGEVVGSENCLTIRSSIIGRELFTTHSLVDWFLSNRGKNKIVRGFTQAIYTGFPTVVFCYIFWDIIENHTDLSGLWHISSEPISKFELLKIINQVFDAKIQIEPFADFHCDRSLDSSRFRAKTKFQPAQWNTMIEQMAEDSKE